MTAFHFLYIILYFQRHYLARNRLYLPYRAGVTFSVAALRAIMRRFWPPPRHTTCQQSFIGASSLISNIEELHAGIGRTFPARPPDKPMDDLWHARILFDTHWRQQDIRYWHIPLLRRRRLTLLVSSASIGWEISLPYIINGLLKKPCFKIARSACGHFQEAPVVFLSSWHATAAHIATIQEMLRAPAWMPVIGLAVPCWRHYMIASLFIIICRDLYFNIFLPLPQSENT